MLYYIYDGSFDGLLTAIYDAYYNKDFPEQIVPQDSFTDNFLISKVYIRTEEEKSKKVHDAVLQKISRRAMAGIMYAYLSEDENAGISILEYLRFGFKVGRTVDSYLADDRVNNINRLVTKVAREKHLLAGIIRFRLLHNNIYYAPIEPQYNTLCLLGKHFADRMSDQIFVIHDVKRSYGVFYDKTKWFMSDIEMNKDIVLHENELFYQELWKRYFDNITIKSRINPKLQSNHMPKKYWKYLIEMK
ncbi:MAG TPA: TIGR03915 family putative DNA repair protein [Bacillota bacterium]|nr:TIGR03915 family putative DNA repair protein [Bacillota bacterium]HPL99160.1 TIGR03915 family putative DNA repair protein [Bacillota bacterium]HPW40237.1 TIGR03915 family putative DNA repair protein [Bacillota bacterium]